MTLRLRRIVQWAIAGLALAIGAIAAIAALSLGDSRPRFQAVDITGVPWGKEFALTDHLGRKRLLADFRGKAVALYFGYTRCPDMCPTTMAMLGEALRKLGSDADAVQALFVTVDPKRDTPEVLAQYVPSFYPSLLGLYGDEAATARAAQEFKAYFHANPPDEHGFYTVDHSSHLYVIDPTGRLRLYIKTDAMTPESIAHDLRALLREARG
jgi:protein SCO1/2